MSYDKVAKQLENPAIKIDKLAQYAQGANPMVPEFLALAEIKRRQSLTQPSAGPAPTTVQEDLVRQAMPQPMMQAPQQMPQQMMGLQGMQRPQGVAALPSGMDEQSMAGGGIVAFADGGPADEDESFADKFMKFKENLNKRLSGIGPSYDPRVGAPVNATQAEIQRALGSSGFQAAPQQEEIPVTGYENLPQAYNLSNQTDPSPYMGGEAPSPAMLKPSEKTTPRSKVFKDAAKEEEAPKEDIYAKYEKMLMEQATEGKEARKNDKYMRMLEAGLGIMGGTSPNALTNIAQGSKEAARGYAQDKAAARKEERDNVKELMGLGMKREEAQMKAKEFGLKEKEVAANSDYRKAYAEYLRANKGNGLAANTRLTIAQQNLVHKYYQDLKKDMDNMGVSDDILMQQAMQMAGMSGGTAAPAIMGAYSLKGGYTPTGS